MDLLLLQRKFTTNFTQNLGVFALYVLIYTAFFSPIISREMLLAPGDGQAYFLPAFMVGDHIWTTNIFSGYPIFADPQMMIWYPVAIIAKLFKSWNFFIISAYVLASFNSYLLTKKITGSNWAGVFGGLVYGMGGFLMAHLGHVNMIHSAAWLPAIIYGIEMIMSNNRNIWVAYTAVVIAFCFLAGHPQIFVYSMGLTALYVSYHLALNWGNKEWFSRVMLSFLLGGGIIAVQLLPTMELSALSVRSTMSFEEFNSYSLPLKQIATLVFPYLFGGLTESIYGRAYFGAWNFAELAGYFGIVTLTLGGFSFYCKKSRHLLVFWVFTLVVSLLLIIGDKTPLADVFYHIPGYNLFRVPARHFLEALLAVSVISSIGFKTLLKLRQNDSCLLKPIIAVALILCINYISLFLLKTYSIEINRITFSPWANLSILVPLIIFFLISVLIIVWFKIPSLVRVILVLLLLVADLGSFGYFQEWRYYSVSKEILKPDVLTNKYLARLKGSDQRLVSLIGVQGPLEQLPPNMSLMWDVPNLSGYSPLILRRYSELLGMPYWGELGKDILNDQNYSIDFLATKYLFVPKGLLRPQVEMKNQGYGWSSENLGIHFNSTINELRTTVIKVNTPAETVDSIGIVTSLANSVAVPQGTRIIKVSVQGEDSSTQEFYIRAGFESSEWAFNRSDVKTIVKHKKARVFKSFEAEETDGTDFKGYSYFAEFKLDRPKKVKQIIFESLTNEAVTIDIHKLSLRNGLEQVSYPITLLQSAIMNTERFKKVEDLSQTEVYENLGAMPRAWFVKQVRSFSSPEVLNSIKSGVLPNGEVFNPRQLALVEDGTFFENSRSDNESTVRMLSQNESKVQLVVDCEEASFLVLSDVNYPGWQATIDGKAVPIYTTNYVLRGVMVPEGGHIVEFRFKSLTLLVGSIITLLTVLITVLLILKDLKGFMRRHEIENASR